jgi:UDP-3-O-[3-hydroxymyristoyl] glucosamine N-acyltransferase
LTVQLTVRELAALLGGQFASESDGEKTITGVAAIADAEEGDVTFFSKPKYLPALKVCRATAALVPVDFNERVAPVAIRVANPSLAFSTVAAKFAPEPVHFPAGVHPSAVVGKNVEIGEGASIQALVVVEPGARIGARTVLGAHTYVGHEVSIGADCQIAPRVTIGARCKLGDRVVLHSGVVLGSDGFGFESAEGRQLKVQQIGIVQLDNDVEIGANTTIDRARFGRTWIGEGTKIDNLVQIAHNVVIGKHCIIVAQTGIAGSARLGDYVTLAGQSAVVGHVEIGDRVTAAARSGLSKDFGPNQVLWGAPAQSIEAEKAQVASVRRLPKLVERVRRLEQVLDSVAKSSPPGS